MKKKKNTAKKTRTPRPFASSISVPKAISQTRKDIADWKRALEYTQMEPVGKWHLLQQIYDTVVIDALFTSQYKNRTLKSLSKQMLLRRPDGNVDEKQTAYINTAEWTAQINRHILDSRFYGYSLIELQRLGNDLDVILLPRTNINPEAGIVFPDIYRDEYIEYRRLPGYGHTLLEFYNPQDKYGLLNSLVPHILFKRFAQSAWSELCEIYGIPPRVLKTDTSDPEALQRGREMMENMGAAAWMIIDENEEFSFAAGVSTNGDVYRNLIAVCNNEISMLVSGAIIGQDTKNGSRAKDESAKEMLRILIENDLRLIENYWNAQVIPALKKFGLITGDLIAVYPQEENLERLWKMTTETLPYYDVDTEWIREKFGIPITGKRSADTQLSASDNDFFD